MSIQIFFVVLKKLPDEVCVSHTKRLGDNKTVFSMLAKQNETKNSPVEEISLWTDRSIIRKYVPEYS